MSVADPVFVASAFGRTGITPTIGLGMPLYVIRGTFVHPVTGRDTPLPSHHWLLGNIVTGTTVSISVQSDASGLCVVNDVAEPGQGGFVLGFVPAPVDVRNFFVDNNEGWIDLDSGTWASPQPDRDKVEQRNLFRLPAWSTSRKAARGGGFKAWPDKASQASRERGVLSREDVLRKPFGSTGSPWEIAIDFNWVHATVRYFYFDWNHDKQNTLPPGLFIDAVPARPDSVVTRVGSGTAIKDGDGSARMLIETDAARWGWQGIDFQFRTPRDARIDLAAPEPAAGSKDTRMTAVGAVPADRNTRYVPPFRWHSLGHRCKATAGGKTYGRSWTALRTELDTDHVTDVTAEFHLDDVQLVNNDGTIHDKHSGRPALFDHFMKLMDRVASRPHQSDTTVDVGFLIADKAFTVGQGTLAAGQKRLELSTRLVHLEGNLFDLRDDRVDGDLGRTVMIGARAAIQNAHLFANYGGSGGANPFLENQGFYELHYIDVPGVQDPRASKPLGHMLVFVSWKLDPAGLPESVVNDFYLLMTEAAERWSQGCPGVPGATKDYRIVSKDPAVRDMVIRPRMYFGEVTSGEILKMELAKGGNRSNTGELVWWLRFAVTPTMAYFDGSIAFDKGRLGRTAADSDGFTAAWHTLAHEFGHVFGLPDEYGEELDPATVDPSAGTDNPRVLGYPPLVGGNEGMPTDYRPFYGDRFAQMNQNTLPRLRHYWHHVESLNKDSAFNQGRGIRGNPFVIRHETLGGGIDYVRPADEHKHPYVAFFSGKDIPNGRGECALFPVGQDEGVTEALFVPPGTPSPSPLALVNRVDGVLVVRSKVRFRFDGTVVPFDRWQLIWKKFIGRLYDENHRQHLRFALVGGTKLSRIAVFLQPHCAEGVSVRSDDFKLFLSSTSTPPPDPFAAGTVSSSVTLDAGQFSAFSVLRAILGVSTSMPGTAPPAPPPPAPPLPPPPPVANTTPLTPADLVNLAALVDRELGDPAGTRRVVPL